MLRMLYILRNCQNSLDISPSIMRSSICIILRSSFNNQLDLNNHHASVNVPRRCFFDLPFKSSSSSSSECRKKFADQKIVRFTPLQLFNVVSNVEDYDQFVPNCLGTKVICKKPDFIEAEMVVGLQPLITERYTSLIYLDKPNRVLVQGINSTIIKKLESEWKFEELNEKRTLVKFRVEFEFQSKLHSRLMDLFFDDFSKKAMQAFLDRAYIIYTADPLYFDADKS